MNRRALIDRQEFDLHYLYKMMRSLFPRKNDCATLSDLAEVVDELRLFSITTRLQVRTLLKKHRRQLLIIDKEPLDAFHQRLYREDMGDERYLDAIRRQYWFCYPALVRIAMEIEFGDRYEQFARERDG
ncbi:hypothetical protein [Hahella ganghwensis]|uniref:hypothetical protein n=1 Tax=Hahella ganghwensis TaxID=286420 RepID=UPI0003A069B4|nr:hypothetical protein [Hahella ganghwensis]